MNRKYLYIIPFTLMEIVVQMIYFWIAPYYGYNWAVYSFLTVMTLLHFAFMFFLLNRYEGAKVSAAVRTGSILQIINIAAAVVLLTRDPSLRSVIFWTLLLSILYVAVAMYHWIDIYVSEDADNHSRNAETIRSGRRSVVNTGHEKRTAGASRSVSRGTPPPLPVRR